MRRSADTVSARDRWLALALLLGAVLAAYLLLVHPWFTQPMRALGEHIDTLQERELRIRRELDQAPEVRAALDQARAAMETMPGFMPQGSVELATAALVQRLEQAVVEASPGNRSCAISNRSPMTGGRAERYPRASVQVRLRCGNPELAAVLHSLETGTPRLFVDNLNILAQRYFFAPGQGGNQTGGLDVNFDLYGYLRPPPAKPAATQARQTTQTPGADDSAP